MKRILLVLLVVFLSQTMFAQQVIRQVCQGLALSICLAEAL